MAKKTGKQVIGCSVNECAHNNSEFCNLEKIVVRPCCDQAKKEDETMCASFDEK